MSEYSEQNERPTRTPSILPNIYKEPYNSIRIKAQQLMAKNWNISESTVLNIFNDACDWQKSLLEFPWIKRSDLEPPTTGRTTAIIVFIKSSDGVEHDDIDIAGYRSDKKIWEDYYFKKKVEFTHWMPLPEHP